MTKHCIFQLFVLSFILLSLVSNKSHCLKPCLEKHKLCLSFASFEECLSVLMGCNRKCKPTRKPKYFHVSNSLFDFLCITYMYYLFLIYFKLTTKEVTNIIYFFGSDPSPQSCLYFQDFQGSELLNSSLLL